MADPHFYESSFGDLRLFLTRISTDRSRSHVVHEPSVGDEYVVLDRGRAPVRARCTVLFAYMRGDDLSPLERLQQLHAVIDDKPRIFRHPVSGSYLARIGPFTEDIDEDSRITAEIEVIQVSATQAVAPAGAGTIPATGEGAVSAAADDLAAELDDLGMDSSLPSDAAAAVSGWTATDSVNTRQVLADTGSLTAQLGAQADALDGDIGFWSAYKATVLLAEAVRVAADAATADSAQTFMMQIGSPVALRALLSTIYSADEVDERYNQALALNDILAPAWIEPGTELILPQLTAQQRIG